MGQLLVTLIIPPIVGLVTYIVVRHIWERDENGVYALNQSGGTVVFGNGIQGAVPPRDQSNVEASYKVGDGMETVTCHCGAIYETIETTGPPRTKAHLNASCARKNYPPGPMCNFVLGSSLNRIESDALGFKAREQFAGHFDSDYL